MFRSIIGTPSFVEIQTADGWKIAEKSGGKFSTEACEVEFRAENGLLNVVATETRQPTLRIRVRWNDDFSWIQRVLGDEPGVELGDLAWMPLVPERMWTWYVQCFDGERTHGFGVKTGCNSFCFWQLDEEGIALILDIRNGGSGVMLREPLLCAQIIEREGKPGETAYRACQDFCRMMCDKPNLPDRPIFGLNNWYYAYGNITKESVLVDCELTAELCPGTHYRPYMLIDDGWQRKATDEPHYNGGPFTPNDKFCDMQEMAYQMSRRGVEPGVWIRPLLTKESVPNHWLHPRRLGNRGGMFLDPSKDEVLQFVADLVSRTANQGFKMIKYDFTAPDMLTANIYDEIYLTHKITDPGWKFDDTGVTNAQIIKKLYQTVQTAAGDTQIMGCNTYNHLAAGIHQIQRSGLDTSGGSWNTTRKMGVNSLAFRLPQNKNFFITDPDCAAITSQVPTEMNLRFFELCALSGTSLFISITPGMLDSTQKNRLAASFAIADKGCSMEPLDWFKSSCPRDYLVGDTVHHFKWYDITNGVNVF